MKRQAFTLIEILVTVSIILLLSGTMLASFSRFNDDKQLEKEVDQVEVMIQQIKQNAQAPQKTSVCTDNFLSYSLRLSGTNNHTVGLYSFCQNGASIDSEVLTTYVISNSVGPITMNTYDGFSFSPIEMVSFRPQAVNTSVTSVFSNNPTYTLLNSTSTIQIKFTNASGKVCDFIAINAAGAIKKQTRVNCTADHISI